MPLYKKIVIAISIFGFMFLCAWWINEIGEERYFQKQQHDEQLEPFSLGGQGNEEIERERFRPREYIKVTE